MINRKHKDRLFAFLFGRAENREWTLQLYNAVNGTAYDVAESEKIEITTMEDVLYMGMKNDVSLLLFWMLNIYEQQSTFNPNAPLREFMYAAKLYDKYIHKNRLNLYGDKIIQLPVPKLVVFYNGIEEKEDDIILELKDAFPERLREGISDISVRVRMLNINKGRNKSLMDACRPLAEYAWLIEEIRMNRKRGMDIEQAVDKAITDMPPNYIIRSFLIGHKAEVKDMCLTEYNEAETLQLFKEEYTEKGRKEGEDKLCKLINELIMRGRMEDIQKAASDEQTRFLLYKEFHIQ